MKITTLLTPKELNPDLVDGKVVVVADILRFSTTVLTAIHNQARVILPVASPEQAVSLYESLGKKGVLLCGERGGLRIEGFHLGNSPLEYGLATVRDKTLIITTTNGTRVLLKTTGARTVQIGGFLNLSSLREEVSRADEIVLICCGQEDRFALEDLLFCGALARSLAPAEVDDATRAAIELYEKITDLTRALLATDHGRELERLGFKEDVLYSAQVDLFETTARYHEGRITRG